MAPRGPGSDPGPEPVPAPVPRRRHLDGRSAADRSTEGGAGSSPAIPAIPAITSTPSPEVAAEAAVWIARLHGPDRSVQMERECLAWQARSAMHRLAFERCTEVWEAVPGLSLADAFSAASNASTNPASVQRWRGPWLWGGVALTAVAAVLTLGALLRAGDGPPRYTTGVGEQRSVLLDDGSRLTLNTNTRVGVALTPERRTVLVEKGEALFEVVKDARRPFVVRASGSEVVALGTAFAVRLSEPAAQGPALAVTLIEGQVSVRAATGVRTTNGNSRSSDRPDDALAPGKELTLSPGERVRLVKPAFGGYGIRGVERPQAGTVSGAGGLRDGLRDVLGDGAGSVATAVVTWDRPRIDQITAWKRSEVVFDDVSLPEAVGEMNRYNREPIVLAGDTALSHLRVSGSYRAGDSDGFARAAAMLHGLVLRRHDGRFELLRPQ